MLRIIVIGTSGSGKTTLARELARRLGLPHAEQDAWNHEPNWQEPPPERFRAHVDAFTFGPAWVMNGNYSKARDIGWARADTLVWLDYSRPVVMRRVIPRTLRRIITWQELWNGNRETWRVLFDGPIQWAWTTHPRRRRETPGLAAQYPHLKLVHLRSPQEAQAWLNAVTRS